MRRIHITRRFLPVLLFTLLSVGCSTAIDDATAKQFQSAEDAFADCESESDFLAVAGRYQQILDSGIQSGTVLYNQGNAFMKAGKPGRAIAAYQQAQRYRPSDPLLDSNLRTAQKQVAVEHTSSIVDRLLFWQNWVSYGSKFVLTTALLVMTLACFLLARFTAASLLVRTGIIAAVLTMLAGLSTGYDWYRFDVQIHGVVVDNETIARKGSAETYDPAFTEPLPVGTTFTVQETLADWVRVRLSNASEGWLPRNRVVVY